MTRTQSCCKRSFGRKHPIITSIVVCSGPLHLKSRIFALGVLRDNIIMQGIKRWADVRVWLSPVHKHLILQRWDQSRDCAQQGHKHIVEVCESSLLFCFEVRTCTHWSYKKALLCAAPPEFRTLNKSQGRSCHRFMRICCQERTCLRLCWM